MPKAKVPVKVVQDKDAPIATEIIAQSIVDIAEGMKAIDAGRLNRRAVLVLLKDSTGVSLDVINRVLNALGDLKADYVKR